MESTESIAKQNHKNSNFPILDKMDNVHVNWSEVDDEDNLRRHDLPEL